MEGELEQKQNYLRINILERGYDAEQFMTFLQTKKGDLGLDLNNWSINELTLAVQEFMILQNSQNIIMNNEQEIQQNENKENKENDNNNNNIIQMDQMEMENNPKQKQFQSQEEFIPCEKVVPNEFFKTKGIDIKLSFPEKVQGSLFTKSYVTYLMQTTPLGFSIRKRYSDFEWLRNILSTIYVNCVIPPLCKKNYADRFNEVLISKRTRSIEKFMNGVLIHPLMRNSEIFYNFISIEKESDFEKKKKEYNRLSSPTLLNQVKSLDGQLKVTVSNEKEIYFENIKDYVNLNEDLLQKITKAYKTLVLIMEQLGDKIKELSDLWKVVYQQNVKYYEKPNTTTSFDILSKIMLDWNEINKKQTILLNEGIREYFRYVKNEFRGIKELALKVDNNKIIYSKAFDKLIALKENVFRQDISHWGLNEFEMENKAQLLTNKNLAFAKMLPKDTKKVDEVRQYYGFYLNSIISEFERIRELNGKRHKNKIKSFVQNFIESLKDFQVYLSDRVSNYDDIKDEEKEEKEGKEEKEVKEEKEIKEQQQNNDENEIKN